MPVDDGETSNTAQLQNELAATREKIDAVETKIDELTRMIQYYLRNQQSLAGDSSPDTPL